MITENIPIWRNLSLCDLTVEIAGTIYNEQWKDVIGWEGFYKVSNFGRVKSLGRIVYRSKNGLQNRKPLIYAEKILKQNNLQTGGYCAVKFCINGSHINVKVHRLVAEAFIPNPYNKDQVNHIRGIKTDNRATELEWATASQNMSHSFALKLHRPGSVCQFGANNPRSKPVAQLSVHGELIKVHSGQNEAARITGVDQSMIWHCCKGKLKTAGGYKWKYA